MLETVSGQTYIRGGRALSRTSRPIGTFRQIGDRPVGKVLWSSREAFFSDIGLFVLGASGAFSANIVGSIPGCELLLLPVLPVLLLAKGGRAFNRRYLWFYVLALAWLLGTLIADAFNDIGIFNRAKGTARVVFFIFDFAALAVLLNNKTRRFIIFCMSFAAEQLMSSWPFRGQLSEQWKFGLSQTCAVMALLAASYFYARKRYWVWFVVSVALSALNLAFGFRSQLVVQLVSTVLLLPIFKATNLSSVASAGHSRMKVLALLVLACGAVYGASAAIKGAARVGLFDDSTKAKFVGQASGDYGVLVGGRPETLVAIQAIRDSPIIGHGSFPYGLKYLQMETDIQYEHGYSDSDEADQTPYPVIPTHSHLTLAWVEGGILGGICWIYLFGITGLAVLRVSLLRPGLAPLYCYFLVSFLWDILYSPFGSVNRLWAAFFLLLSYQIINNAAPDSTWLAKHGMVRKVIRSRGQAQRAVHVRPA